MILPLLQHAVLANTWTFLLAEALLADVVPIPELKGPLKAKLLAALAGLLILGGAMMALTWLGGRFTRRYMKSEHLQREKSPPASSPDDWARKPLVPREDEKKDR